MLALVVAVALGQCTKDTECKGDRICSAGECVDAAPRAPFLEAPAATPAPEATNPYRVHRIIGTVLAPTLWAITIVFDLLIGDSFWFLTAIPLVGPAVTYFAVVTTPGAYFYGAWAPALLWLSTGLQIGALLYLIAAGVSEANWSPAGVTIGPGPGLLGLSAAVRF